jgi:RNA polymerase subunit RPABC4/transcription elongation factor Spt4
MTNGGAERTGDPAPNEEFCTSCGTVVHSEAVMCPECGVERNSRTDVTDAGSRERLMNLQAQGWEVEDRYSDGAVLIDRSVGAVGTHILVALLTVWWTGGMGNAAYAGYKYFVDVDRQVVHYDTSSDGRSVADELFCRSCGTEINASADICPHCGVRAVDVGSSSTSRSVTEADIDTRSKTPTFQWIAGVLLTLAGITGTTDAAGPAALAGGIAMLLLGLYLIPPVRERIRSDYPATAFGRHQRVEETVLRGGERPCSVCFDPVESGVERDFHDEFVVFGVAVYTYESGTNEYCNDCVSGRAQHTADIGSDIQSQKEPRVEYETE